MQWTVLGTAYGIIGGVGPMLLNAIRSNAAGRNATAAKQQTAFGMAMLLHGPEVLALLFVGLVIYDILTKLLPRSTNPVDPLSKEGRKIRAAATMFPMIQHVLDNSRIFGAISMSDDTRALADRAQTAYLTATLAGIASIGWSIVQESRKYVMNVASTSYSLMPAYVGFGALTATGYVLNEYADTIVPPIHEVYNCWIQPLLQLVILPLANIGIVMTSILSFGVFVFIVRTMKNLEKTPFKVLTVFSLPSIPVYAELAAKIVSGLLFAFYAFVTNDPMLNLFPAFDVIHNLATFIAEIWSGAIYRSCRILEYVVGGIGFSFEQETLSKSLTSLINVPWAVLQVIFFQPIRYKNTPRIEPLDDISNSIFNNMGLWLQNVTVKQFDIYIGADLVGYVNGTVPVPDGDNIIYLVRALKIRWAEGLGFWVTTVISVPLELIRLAFNPQKWFKLKGNQFLTFEMFRVNLVRFVSSAETVFHVLPECSVSGSGIFEQSAHIQYGDIIGGLVQWLISVVYIAWELVTGEVYTLLSFSAFPGQFSANYFATDGKFLQEALYQGYRASLAVGCLVGQLAPDVGKFVNGAAKLVLGYLFRVPLYITAYARLALESGRYSIMKQLDNGPSSPFQMLERDATALEGLAGVIYAFENTDTARCVESLSVICSIGKIAESAIRMFVQALMIVLRMIKMSIEFAVETLFPYSGEPRLVLTSPNTAIFQKAAYTFGCRVGTFAGGIIPVNIPCFVGNNRVCRVGEFQNLPQNTPTICVETFLCRVGNWFGAAVKLLFSLLDLSVEFGNMLKGSNPNAISGLTVTLRLFFRVLAYDVLSPLCPAAHYIDCWLDTMGFSGMTVSKFICLINSFVVKLIEIVSDIVIEALKVVIYFVQLIFSPSNAASALANLIQSFFTLIGTSFFQLLGAIVGLFLNFLVAIVEGICNAVCFFTYDVIKRQDSTACIDCRKLVDAMRGNAAPFLDPNFDGNYMNVNKKRQTTTAGDARCTALGCMSLSLQRTFGLLDVVYVTDPVTGTTTLQEVPYYLSDPETIPTHLATRVVWTTGTKCAKLFQMVNGTRMSDLGISERLDLDECVADKALSATTRAASPLLSWFPDDMFYSRFRWAITASHILRFIPMFAEFWLDKALPHDIVMSQNYQLTFAVMGLNTTHYTNEFAARYPGPNKPAAQYAPFVAYVKSLPIAWYMNRNFPELDPSYNYSASSSSSSANYVYTPLKYATALEKSYASIGAFVYTALEQQYNYTLALSSSNETAAFLNGTDPVTGMNMTDGSLYSLTNVYVWGNVSNVRSTIFDFYGDEYVTAFDERASTMGLYNAMARLGLTVFNAFSDARSVYSETDDYHFMDVLESGNYMNLAGSSVSSTYSSYYTQPPAPTSFAKRYATFSDEQKAELKKNAARVKRDVGATGTNAPAIKGWRDLIDNIKLGYAQGVDYFMEMNGATLQTTEHSKKRDANYSPPVPLQKRTPFARTVVALVAATATFTNLNTTYTPYWCNSSSEARFQCANADWRNAARYVSDDPAAFNWTVDTLTKVSEFANDILRPRSEKAAMARAFVTGTASAVTTFVSGIVSRAGYQIEKEDVVGVIASAKAAMKAPMKQVAESLSKHADTMQERLSKAASGDDGDLPEYVSIEEQYRRFKEFSETVKSDFGNASTSIESAFSVNVASIYDTEFEDFMDSYKYRNPTAVRLARPNRYSATTAATAAVDAGLEQRIAQIGKKTSKAFVGFLTEEKAIMRDVSSYRELFSGAELDKTEFGVSPQRFDVRRAVMNVESLYMRKKLSYAAQTGKLLDETAVVLTPGEFVPHVQIRTYDAAYLRSREIVETVDTFSVDSTNSSGAAVISSSSHKKKVFSLAYGDDAFRAPAGADFIQTQEEGGIRLYKNVVEIRVLPIGSDRTGIPVPGMASAQAASAYNAVHSHFSIGTIYNETIDFASKLLRCRLGSDWLCEECAMLDQLVGIEWESALWSISYYTLQALSLFMDTVKWLTYAYDTGAAARIGYGEYPARWPALGVPTGYWLRHTEREVANLTHPGPRWAWFFEERFGTTFPDQLTTNGTAYKGLEFYWDMRTRAAADARNTNFTKEYSYELFGYANNTLGIPLLQILDTVTSYLTAIRNDLGSFFIRTWRCDYEESIDCSARTYSLTGIVSLLLDVYVVVGVAILFIQPYILVMWIGICASTFLPSVLVFGYGWSLSCGILLPSCFIKDVWDVLTLTIVSKCSPIFGLFISSNNYNTQTCYTCNSGFGQTFFGDPGANEFTYINCRATGFENVYDGIIVLENSWLANGQPVPWKLELLHNIVDGVFSFSDNVLGTNYTAAASTATRQWSTGDVFENWATSAAAYSTFFGCGMWSTMKGVGTMGLATTAAANVAIPTIAYIAPVIALIILNLSAPLMFAMSVISRMRSEGVPMFTNILLGSQLKPGFIEYTVFGGIYSSITDNDLEDLGFDGYGGDNDDDEDEEEGGGEGTGLTSRAAQFAKGLGSTGAYSKLLDLEKKLL